MLNFIRKIRIDIQKHILIINKLTSFSTCGKLKPHSVELKMCRVNEKNAYICINYSVINKFKQMCIMLEKVLNWIKLRMPVSRREFDMKVRLLEETAHVDILSKTLDKVITETNGLYNRHNDLSMAVKTSNEELTERFERLNKKMNGLTSALMSAKPKEVTGVDIAGIDKCPWDLEDHKLGKCVFLTDEEKATLISLLENRCASLGYQSICSADATVMQYCEKNIIELQTLINKFK